MFYYNTTEKKWQDQPYMVKEWSVAFGPYLATAVIVPMAKKVKKKDGSVVEKQDFILMGVRIEDTRSRTAYGDFRLPGHTYFWQRKTERLSETKPCTFLTDCCGRPYVDSFYPSVNKPAEKWCGVPIAEHKMGKTLDPLVRVALERYDEYRAEKRAAAA